MAPEDHPSVRTEIVPWRFVDRSRRKGYMTRDFFVGIRRYRHFASGATEQGVVRYGVEVDAG